MEKVGVPAVMKQENQEWPEAAQTWMCFTASSKKAESASFEGPVKMYLSCKGE